MPHQPAASGDLGIATSQGVERQLIEIPVQADPENRVAGIEPDRPHQPRNRSVRGMVLGRADEVSVLPRSVEMTIEAHRAWEHH